MPSSSNGDFLNRIPIKEKENVDVKTIVFILNYKTFTKTDNNNKVHNMHSFACMRLLGHSNYHLLHANDINFMYYFLLYNCVVNTDTKISDLRETLDHKQIGNKFLVQTKFWKVKISLSHHSIHHSIQIVVHGEFYHLYRFWAVFQKLTTFSPLCIFMCTKVPFVFFGNYLFWGLIK